MKCTVCGKKLSGFPEVCPSCGTRVIYLRTFDPYVLFPTTISGPFFLLMGIWMFLDSMADDGLLWMTVGVAFVVGGLLLTGYDALSMMRRRKKAQ